MQQKFINLTSRRWRRVAAGVVEPKSVLIYTNAHHSVLPGAPFKLKKQQTILEYFDQYTVHSPFYRTFLIQSVGKFYKISTAGGGPVNGSLAYFSSIGLVPVNGLKLGEATIEFH